MLLLHAFKAPAALRPAGGAALEFLRRSAGRLAAWCARCYARYEQRRDLSELDERLLKDVGISPADAARESAKPWWRA